jgi:hypothetical protein
MGHPYAKGFKVAAVAWLEVERMLSLLLNHVA